MDKEKIEIMKGLESFKEKVSKLGIEKIIVFGSFARGEMKKDSDIDLILVGKRFKGKKFFERALGLHWYWKLHYPVDFICYTPKEFEKLKKRVSIVSTALREGIAV